MQEKMANPRLIVSATRFGRRPQWLARTLPSLGREPLVAPMALDEAVLDEMQDGLKPIWLGPKISGMQSASQPSPLLSTVTYTAASGHFGPQKINENSHRVSRMTAQAVTWITKPRGPTPRRRQVATLQ